ncbi:peptidoglycan-binding domain-containing protein [Kitasatospora sp. NPDC051914]|uniref:peptidoglycan-binding domain-containing protein n=1 Tax=Kitasatospora sp. NPDC051914 TaxID=3154945 RepID=UPI00342A8491
MPGELCPLCGTVRTAVGCACASSSPDAAETAVLPHVEGPPLVRPYVSAGHGHGYGHAAAGPTADPFATTLMPPVPAVVVPPPPAAPPPAVPQQRPAPDGRPASPGGPVGPGGDLGVFDFHGTPQQRPGGRADRREQDRLTSGRRRTVVIAAGLGIAAVGAGLALALAPASEPSNVDQALPSPNGTVDALPPDLEQPGPTASASSSASRKASASPGRSTAQASREPAVALSPAGSGAPTGSTSSSAAPSASGVRVLKPGDSGADVRAMQQLLITTSCGSLNVWFATGNFDSWTQWILSEFQRDARIKGDERNGTLYGPKTRAALEKEAADPNC